jgi:hypothetical protein
LDAVKAEIAVAASSRGTLGRQLGATVASSANRLSQASSEKDGNATEYDYAAASANVNSMACPSNIPPEAIRPLAPRSQAVAAVAQDEWERQGIGFTSRAEQRGSETAAGPSGAKILANLIQQSLIFDQHDRVVQEQQEALRSKMNDAQQHKRNPRDTGDQ